MHIKGVITHVGEVTTGTGSKGEWNKFQAVITEQGPQYPKSLVFDVFNDKVAVALGEECTIHFETKANEYNGKFYNNINAWRKEGASAASAASAPSSAPAPAPVAEPAPTGGKLTISSAMFSAAVTKIEAMANGPEKDAAIQAMKDKYELSREQADTLDSLVLPF